MVDAGCTALIIRVPTTVAVVDGNFAGELIAINVIDCTVDELAADGEQQHP